MTAKTWATNICSMSMWSMLLMSWNSECLIHLQSLSSVIFFSPCLNRLFVDGWTVASKVACNHLDQTGSACSSDNGYLNVHPSSDWFVKLLWWMILEKISGYSKWQIQVSCSVQTYFLYFLVHSLICDLSWLPLVQLVNGSHHKTISNMEFKTVPNKILTRTHRMQKSWKFAKSQASFILFIGPGPAQKV